MKQRKAIAMAALLSVALLVAAVFMVTASVNHSANQKDSIDPELVLLGVKDPEELADLTREEIANLTKNGIPDFGPEVFEEMEKDPRVLDTYGTIPRFGTEGERRNWLDELDEIGKGVRTRGEMRPYFYPEGPVIAYGYDYRGYYMVIFEENMVVEESLMDEIYEMINEEAEGMGIQEVPVVFKLGGFPELQRTRDDEFRPLIGGVQIEGGGELATLGFAAEDGGGNEGYLVTGHLGDGATPVGLQIWQPEDSCDAGEVNQTGGTFADASWVPYNNVEAKIYLCGTEDYEIIRPVTGYRDHPDVGDIVFKSGRTTGLTMGTVKRLIHNCGHPVFGTLHDQYQADYTSACGDSGSPVYIYTYHPDDPEREIVGIHWGSNPTFSPVSGVKEDLGIEPLTE